MRVVPGVDDRDVFDLTETLDDLRCRPLAWLHAERIRLRDERRRLHLRELAVTRILDERGAIDDTLAAADGIDPRDVRATLETARALESLPHLAAAAADGRLSPGQLHAAAQLADPTTDAEWAERAPRCAPADLVREARTRRVPTTDDTRRRFEARSLRYWWSDRTGMLEGRFALPDLLGAEFESVVQQITERMRPARGQPWEPHDRRAADALVALARRARGDGTTLAEGIVPKVLVTVPADGPATVADGVLLSHAQVEQLRGDASITLAVVDDRGGTVALSRSTRTISTRLRNAVLARTGRCAWPGCPVRHGLELHHLVPVSHGGPTVAANLAPVCAPHHRRLVPHGTLALVGNPARVDGLRLVRDTETHPDSGPAP